MSTTDSEAVLLARARRASRSWRMVRVVLVPIALASIALGLYVAGASEFANNPLTNYLTALLLMIGVGISSILITGWSDSKNAMLIRLLKEKTSKE